MKITPLFQITFSQSEPSLWWNDEPNNKTSNGWGIVLRFNAGRFVRPILHPKHWFKPRLPRGYDDPESENYISNPEDYKKYAPNIWKMTSSDAHWFVVNIPVLIAPFLSINFGGFGAYIGFKPYGLDWPEYKKWYNPDEIYNGSQALALSARTTSDITK